jgi:hypothetical protein
MGDAPDPETLPHESVFKRRYFDALWEEYYNRDFYRYCPYCGKPYSFRPMFYCLECMQSLRTHESPDDFPALRTGDRVKDIGDTAEMIEKLEAEMNGFLEDRLLRPGVVDWTTALRLREIRIAKYRQLLAKQQGK